MHYHYLGYVITVFFIIARQCDGIIPDSERSAIIKTVTTTARLPIYDICHNGLVVLCNTSLNIILDIPTSQ